MKPRLFFWIGILVAVLAASSCASAETSAPALPTVVSVPVTAAPQATLAPTQIGDVQAIPTSRGPNLEATDPTTVKLASGQLQLVEFFRFT